MSATASAVQSLSYLADTYRTDASTVVMQVEPSGELLIEDCIFHPQGGGQPADCGWVDDIAVTPVKDHETGRVLLRVADGPSGAAGGWSAGRQVTARVDRPLRLQHAALHSAGHLIEAAGRILGWELAGNNHFPGQARIEFTAGSVAVPATLEERDRDAARLRAYLDRAVAAAVPITSDTDATGRRVVSIGELHSAPCGGTHVRTLADLLRVEVEVKVRKGRIRVSYTAEHQPSA